MYNCSQIHYCKVSLTANIFSSSLFLEVKPAIISREMETVVLQRREVQCQCSGDDFNDLVSNSDTIHAVYLLYVYFVSEHYNHPDCLHYCVGCELKTGSSSLTLNFNSQDASHCL